MAIRDFVMRQRPSAFAIIELLVVMAIIAMLAGLLMGAVQQARAAAEKSACQNHLLQISLAVHSYVVDHEVYPMTYTPDYFLIQQWPYSASNVSWQVHLLPYLEQQKMYMGAMDAIRQDYRPDMNPPHRLVETVVPAYLCQSDWRIVEPQINAFGDKVGLSSYLGVSCASPNYGIDSEGTIRGIFYRSSSCHSARPEEVTDGLSNTLMIGERPPPPSWNAGWWYSNNMTKNWDFSCGPNVEAAIDSAPLPGDPWHPNSYGPGSIHNEADRCHFWSLHRGGANFSFADGSVRFMPYTAAPRMAALATMAGGEPAEPE